MRAPSSVEREAIAHVAARQEGQIIYAYLRAAMDDLAKSMILHNDAHEVRALQGEGRVLQTLLTLWKP